MTDRQRKFVDEYLLCLNATEAAKRAGYSSKSAKTRGSLLLDKPEIKAEIKNRLAEVQSEKTCDIKTLCEFLSAVVRGEERDEQLMTRLIGKGNSIIERHEFRATIRDRIKAAEILLRIQGAFDKPEESKDSAMQLFIDTLTKISAKEENLAEN